MLLFSLPLLLVASAETGLTLNMSFLPILQEYSHDCTKNWHADTAITLHQFSDPTPQFY